MFRMSTRRGRGRGRAAEAQPSQFDGAQFMRDMAATMRTMARDAQREAQAEAQLGGARVGAQEEEAQSHPRGGDNRALFAMREFLRTNPPSFGGEPDPMAAEEWLEEMIKVFETLQIVEDDLRVSFATFRLTGAARD